MVNCINLVIEISPRFILGRENVPCVAEVVNRSLKADCTDYTKYWIIRGRQIVKSVISKGTTCKRHQDTQYSAPTTAPLTEFRICVSDPFDKTGVDFCGPVYIKVSNETESKVYI